MPHKRINRIVFYLNDEEEGRLDKAVDESGLIRADYLREVLDSVWSGALASTNGSTDGALREAQAQNHGGDVGLTEPRTQSPIAGSSVNLRSVDAYAAVAIEQRPSPVVACLVMLAKA